jgi:hypothetical protein
MIFSTDHINSIYAFIPLLKPVVCTPALRSGHFEFKILRSSTVVHLLSAETQMNIIDHYQATFCQKRVKEVNILLKSKRPACPVRRLLKCARSSRFKRFILSTPLSLCLLRNMSVPSSDDLKNYECKRGKITQRPPIS